MWASVTEMMGVKIQTVNKQQIVEWFRAVAKDNDELIQQKESLGLKIGDLQLQLATKVDAIQQTKEAVNESLKDQIKKLMKQTAEDSTTIINLRSELGIKHESNENTKLLEEDIESKTQQIIQLELYVKKMEKETRLQNDQKAHTITDLKNQVEKLEVQLEMKNQKLKEYVSFKKQHD